MTAIIVSSIPTKPTVIGASRNDLRTGDVVTLTPGDLSHSTYNWQLSFTPEQVDGTPSTAVLTAATGTSTSFTVDNEGSYLIRLVADYGLLTESTQFVRLRFLTKFGGLFLVAAGERRDQSGVIPVDIDLEGWANEQNRNLQTLLAFVERVSTSGRTLWVDANRGLDNSNTPNDPTIAEEYADYSTINAAISGALATLPAPSLSNPFVIKVKPGFYEEDLQLAAHVHVIAEGSDTSSQQDRTVLIRSQNLGGTNHEANLLNVGDFTIIRGLTLENTDPGHILPVMKKTGSGTLYVDRTLIVQNGNSVTQGPVLQVDGGVVIGVDSDFSSNNAAAADRLSVVQNAASSQTFFDRCVIRGPSAMDINPNNFANAECTIRRSIVESTYDNINSYAIQSSSDLLKVEWSEVLLVAGGVSDKALQIHPLGNPKGSDVIAEVKHSILRGAITFDPTGVAGTAALRIGAVEFTSMTLTAPLTHTATVRGESILYDNTSSGFSWTDVQGALDQLAAIMGTIGAGPSYLSLDTAYDGFIDPSTTPPTPGAGTGRTILADQGAVQIIAAFPPAGTPTVQQTDGHLQVEGNVEVGGVGAPEIDLDPNPFDAGPEIRMGQTVWPDIPVSPPRSLPAATIRARATGNPLYRNYNLRLETQHADGGGRSGAVIVQGGDSLTGGTDPNAGPVYIQAGSAHDVAGTPADIFVGPGYSSSLVSEGLLKLARPSTATSASLTAAGVFVGGVSGDITFGIPGIGTVTASILNTDALAAVQTKLNALQGLTCVVNPANDPITISTEMLGPNADVYFAFDDQSGVLNTALGDFSNGGGAVFTAGTWPDLIGMGCTLNNELTIFGDLVVTGTITGTLAGLAYVRSIVNITPYPVALADQYLGVDTSIGPVAIHLPDFLPDVGTPTTGRAIIVKDELGQAAINPITIWVGLPATGLIDGVPNLVINTNYGSATMVCNGLPNPATQWFVI